MTRYNINDDQIYTVVFDESGETSESCVEQKAFGPLKYSRETYPTEAVFLWLR